MPVETVRRPDFSQSVIHLTRERMDYAKERHAPTKVAAFSVLKEIVKSGVIRGSGHEGFVKGSQKAACLSEIPLSAISEFASPPSENNGRYRFYGVALSKRSVFTAGGRPAIYLPDAESDWVPKEHKWRIVRFEFGEVDWTHEREWRVPGDLDLTKSPGLYLIVWSATEAAELNNFDSPIKSLVRGILPMEHLTTML